MDDFKKKPIIAFTKFTPYMVIYLDKLSLYRGEPLPLPSATALCRCGNSKRLPFCDNSHVRIGFRGEKSNSKPSKPMKEYRGKEIIICDKRDICSHDGACVNYLPTVFDAGERPWINPDGDNIEKIIEVIKMCPSGALTYKMNGKHYQEYSEDPEIIIELGGPMNVRGGIELVDDQDTQPFVKNHYSLCRCGKSENLPFCDGTHYEFYMNESREDWNKHRNRKSGPKQNEME
jgi:CDGSH-type Zn-finger protein/ferredoxin